MNINDDSQRIVILRGLIVCTFSAEMEYRPSGEIDRLGKIVNCRHLLSFSQSINKIYSNKFTFRHKQETH